jgi:large subunit ribosomal protein L13
MSEVLEWHHLDAKEMVLGHLATTAASLILGKHRPDFAPERVAPVRIVITNTDHVVLTGRKEEQKMYRQHSGYPGGLHERSAGEQRRRDSRRIVELAIRGMLPKNRLRDVRLQNIKLYTGAEHPHGAQVHTT